MRFVPRLLVSMTTLSLAAACGGLLASCSRPGPVKLGFVGGLSGTYAPLGEAGRNGLLLAIEQQNAAGGIEGRLIELLVRDDAQNKANAQHAVDDLVAAGVTAIVGPMTDAMVAPALPRLEDKRIPLISPTATSSEWAGKDDPLFRIMSTDPEYAALLADYAVRIKGLHSVALLLEDGNRVYGESVSQSFREALERQGGHVVQTLWFSNAEVHPERLVQELMTSKPQAVMVVADPVYTERVLLMLHAADPKLQLLGDTADERMLQRTGAAMEGYLATQPFNRDDPSTRYQTFVAAYTARFHQSVSVAAICAYDAGNVVVSALRRKKASETLKDALLREGPFSGVQGDIVFDAFGDTHRQGYVVTVRNGKFAVVE
ncbi:MAG: ABC transporter substrate-binding protein [Burkholderiaceae bacterium]|nr:ABC transporter substrate-binding protein [Roseateles sp.]MBV8470470.1 ABC transporter substrate-binding protein [Burkholderiaceae bacterium]